MGSVSSSGPHAPVGRGLRGWDARPLDRDTISHMVVLGPATCIIVSSCGVYWVSQCCSEALINIRAFFAPGHMCVHLGMLVVVRGMDQSELDSCWDAEGSGGSCVLADVIPSDGLNGILGCK